MDAVAQVDIPRYSVIQYVRDKHRNPHGVLVGIKSDDGFSVGYSYCHRKDRFNKKLGLKIALGRADFNGPALFWFFNDNVPQNVVNMLPDFISRCKRYFKVVNYV